MKRITVLAAALLASFVIGCTPVPSAQKNGTLVKLAKSGLINKTWEAEIVRGGSYGGGTGVQGAPFDFTVPKDKVLLQKVQAAFESQSEVRITYHQEWPALFGSDSGGNYLDSIEVISAEQGGTDRSPAAPVDLPGRDARIDRLMDQYERTLRVLEKQGTTATK